MRRTLGPPSFHVSSSRSVANAVRRRIWRWLYAPHQMRLGSFYCDPHDHIGAERIIMGEAYEESTLTVLDAVIQRLGLAKGTALDIGANLAITLAGLARGLMPSFASSREGLRR